jgi:hypothetical protein
MKFRIANFWLLIIVSTVFFACGDASTKDNSSTATIVANTEAHEANHEAAHSATLTLNNGAKWKADETTTQHVKALQTQFSAFAKQENETVNSYQILATNLQLELDQLVKDCNMSGADHDALHVWLLAVLKDVVALEKVRSVEQGRQSAAKTLADINTFDQYFN